ncbi:TIGR02757 family protein [Aliifodinibius sp. S!AR15-10]|uniref:TIGR02757 family protein n=1 Tax=Aliifodinibius sp. S!AR15-10 TaxID=2950437 RepID=UPI00285E6827|nr:TIGR02757 family protein [Aliifodinibius sp. S!AR15-10]MDR8389725.1 TIGR02757 family protein [Aliifodinibius sp. S!AR15-10]
MQQQLLSNSQILELKPWLDQWVERMEKPAYIDDDPVLFMHAFDDKLDQELAGFFAALMAWGRRDIVIAKVRDFLDRMDNRPAEFIGNFSKRDRKRFEGFKHRTFKPVDMYWLTSILHHILQDYGGFEPFWASCQQEAQLNDRNLMAVFPERFFGVCPDAAQRTRKHISNAAKNSSCKRLYLYLRWTIREHSVVDPGTMNFIDPSELMVPLDVHVARQARVLGILERTYNDWKATKELTEKMRLLDPEDPAKYDYALFGIGVTESTLQDRLVLNPQFL